MVAQIRFLGSSIVGISCNLGFNNQSSSLSISLVDDIRAGDSFSPPSVGTPLFFSIGSLSFGGLLQNYTVKRDKSGNPLYEVQLVDPREILSGTQLIIGNYEGTTQGVPNLLNCYGYLENQAFGNSQTIEGIGMPWPKILSAINSLMSSNSGNFGSRLSFKGFRYTLNLSEVPNPGSLYRFGNNSISLLEALDQLSTDNGCDYYITLQNTSPLTIKYNRVDRANQPPAGLISALINQQQGNVESSSTGFELRNEPTSIFLAGGPIHQLIFSSQILPFYGFDIDGNVLFGTYSDQQNLIQDIDDLQETIDGLPDGPDKDAAQEVLNGLLALLNEYPDKVTLNAAPISDITGQLYYHADILELRCALTSRAMWDNYIATHRPGLAQQLGNIKVHDLDNIRKANNPEDIKKGKPGMDPGSQLNSNEPSKAPRVFAFVKQQAETYYGRKFIVRIPDIAKAVEPETQKIIYSHEVAEGAFVEENVNLGLTELEEDMFKLPDGRFAAFGKFSNDLANLALDNVDTGSSVIQSSNNAATAVYTVIQVDPNIYRVGSVNAVIITLSQPLLKKADTIIGDIRKIVFAVKGQDDAEAANQLKTLMTKGWPAGGFGGLAIYYEPIMPSQMFIPFKSNINNYGPWKAIGVAGKTIFRQDDGLVPWNYNGYAKMNQAAQVEINGAVTNLQAIETGNITLVGEPIVSLGEPIVGNGPNVTNMDISYDVQAGVKTTYHFKTYTPQFGNVSKQIHERMRRSSLTNLEQGKKIRNFVRGSLIKQQIKTGANKALFEHLQKIWQDKTPHSTIAGSLQVDINDANARVCGASLNSFEEAIQGLSLESGIYQQQVIAPLTSLIRPFSTKNNDANFPYKIISPTGIVNTDSLNPFTSNSDLGYAAWGNDLNNNVSGVHRPGMDFDNMRLFGLRGPPVVVGWGYDINTNLTPNDTERKRKSHLWKAGPMDLIWDNHRGVWSVNNRMVGILKQSVSSSSGAMEIWDGNTNTGKILSVWNWFSSTTIPSGKVMAEYFPYANKWYITAAECSGT